MAQADPTKLADFSGFLPAPIAAPYFDLARKSSVVQSLARQIPLGTNGQEIPYSTAKATAAWVSEGGKKPTTESGLALKSIKPHKIAAISVVSAEVVRANPGNYMQILRQDIAEAFAVAFDLAALHGTDSPFGANMYLDATSQTPVEIGTSNKGVWADVVSGMSTLQKASKRVTGFAFDRKAETIFLGALDSSNRPIFVGTDDSASEVVVPGRMAGRPAVIGDNIATPIVAGTPNTGGVVGYGGDWSQCVWGVVGGISYDVSTEASVTLGTTLTSLWEYNLVAIRAEAEYGFLCNDVDAFVPYTNHTA